jgi:hypothetical protein
MKKLFDYLNQLAHKPQCNIVLSQIEKKFSALLSYIIKTLEIIILRKNKNENSIRIIIFKINR